MRASCRGDPINHPRISKPSVPNQMSTIERRPATEETKPEYQKQRSHCHSKFVTKRLFKWKLVCVVCFVIDGPNIQHLCSRVGLDVERKKNWDYLCYEDLGTISTQRNIEIFSIDINNICSSKSINVTTADKFLPANRMTKFTKIVLIPIILSQKHFQIGLL